MSDNPYVDQELESLKSGDVDQITRCGHCPEKLNCKTWKSFQTWMQNNGDSTGMDDHLIRLLNDRRVIQSIIRMVNNTLDNDFVQNYIAQSVKDGLLAYDEEMIKQRRESTRKFWHTVWEVIIFPFKAVGFVLLSPFALIWMLVQTIYYAFKWRQIESEIKDVLPEELILGLDEFPEDMKKEILDGLRTKLIEDGITPEDILPHTKRWGLHFGRWISNLGHQKAPEESSKD